MVESGGGPRRNEPELGGRAAAANLRGAPEVLRRGQAMLRSFWIAGGIFACLLGVELLLIDSAVILPLQGSGGPRVFTAPDWAPWALLSAGGFTIIHFCTGRGSAAHG